MYCWVHYPLVFFVSLGMKLDYAETPLTKTPSLGSWGLFPVFVVEIQGLAIRVSAVGRGALKDRRYLTDIHRLCSAGVKGRRA